MIEKSSGIVAEVQNGLKSGSKPRATKVVFSQNIYAKNRAYSQ